MKITVKYFASIREAIGHSTEQRATSAPSTSAADSSLMTWFNARRTARSRDRLSA